MPKMLTVNPRKGWPLFQRLVVDLLKFMEPHLQKAKLEKAVCFFPNSSTGSRFLDIFVRKNAACSLLIYLCVQIQFLYKGTLRVLLLLLHDFPEFLCDYHLSFCDVIPSSCIQMRNVILSAFPSNMRIPDPYTPNLKVLGGLNCLFPLLPASRS